MNMYCERSLYDDNDDVELYKPIAKTAETAECTNDVVVCSVADVGLFPTDKSGSKTVCAGHLCAYIGCRPWVSPVVTSSETW
jgi:hypothetical protein